MTASSCQYDLFVLGVVGDFLRLKPRTLSKLRSRWRQKSAYLSSLRQVKRVYFSLCTMAMAEQVVMSKKLDMTIRELLNSSLPQSPKLKSGGVVSVSCAAHLLILLLLSSDSRMVCDCRAALCSLPEDVLINTLCHFAERLGEINEA